MGYDHRVKAGNRGDVAKHAALFAALTHTVHESEPPFHYVDIYAGRYEYELFRSGEWSHGIGALDQVRKPKTHEVAAWLQLVASCQARGTYPGSTQLAVETALNLGSPVRVTAFETNEEACSDLRHHLPEPHRVCRRPASATDPEIEGADFVFVDPPTRTARPAILKNYARLPETGLLVWLPVNLDNASAESRASQDDRKAGHRAGLSSTLVRWQPHRGGTYTSFGCLLLYRLSAAVVDALCAAVDDIADLMGWPPPEHEDAD